MTGLPWLLPTGLQSINTITRCRSWPCWASWRGCAESLSHGPAGRSLSQTAFWPMHQPISSCHAARLSPLPLPIHPLQCPRHASPQAYIGLGYSLCCLVGGLLSPEFRKTQPGVFNLLFGGCSSVAGMLACGVVRHGSEKDRVCAGGHIAELGRRFADVTATLPTLPPLPECRRLRECRRPRMAGKGMAWLHGWQDAFGLQHSGPFARSVLLV